MTIGDVKIGEGGTRTTTRAARAGSAAAVVGIALALLAIIGLFLFGPLL